MKFFHYRFFINRITFLGLSCHSNNRRKQQTMNFKLPHVVVCACAKRDEPPSRRRPSRASLAYGLSLMAHGWLAPPAKRIHTAEPQAAVGIPLRLDFLICQSILLAIIGACGEAIYENQCNQCNLWFDINSCPFVSIRGC